MKTKIISIILAVAIAVTGFTVKSSAVLPVIVPAILKVIAEVAIGSITVWAGSEVVKDCVQGSEQLLSDFEYAVRVNNASNASLHSDGIYCVTEGYAPNQSYTFYVSDDVPEASLEYVQYVVDRLNEKPNYYVDLANSTMGGTLNSYEVFKSAVGQIGVDYAMKKAEEYAVANGIILKNNGAIPVYDFNFVGPLPSIDMPEHYTSAKTYNIDGYTLTRPYLLTNTGKFTSATAAELAGCSDILEAADGTAHGTFKFDCTAYSQYVIYNDVLYYNERYNSGTSTTTNVKGNSIGSGVLSYWKDINGRTLEAAGCTSLVGLYSGFCYTNIPNATSAAPVATVSDDDFTTTTGGTTIDIPRTDDEQAISDGIDLGIIDENGNIVLDEDGNIVSIDGLNIDKLMQLIQQIADNGSISFDSVEEYLAEISRLLRLANVDSAAMNTVIANLKELEQAQSKDISEINANVAAIAKALDMSKAEEGEKEDIEFSGLVIEHTGLVEAGAIVDGMPIVQQVKTLFNNLITGYEENSGVNKAPNFRFYWDSNKDGTKEVYTALDLSFLEAPLTNENLEDKGRFNGGLTVREFLQYLMIFLCYILFGVKVIKKLPGLIGGVSDGVEDFKTVDTYSKYM